MLKIEKEIKVFRAIIGKIYESFEKIDSRGNIGDLLKVIEKYKNSLVVIKRHRKNEFLTRLLWIELNNYFLVEKLNFYIPNPNRMNLRGGTLYCREELPDEKKSDLEKLGFEIVVVTDVDRILDSTTTHETKEGLDKEKTDSRLKELISVLEDKIPKKLIPNNVVKKTNKESISNLQLLDTISNKLEVILSSQVNNSSIQKQNEQLQSEIERLRKIIKAGNAIPIELLREKRTEKTDVDDKIEVDVNPANPRNIIPEDFFWGEYTEEFNGNPINCLHELFPLAEYTTDIPKRLEKTIRDYCKKKNLKFSDYLKVGRHKDKLTPRVLKFAKSVLENGFKETVQEDPDEVKKLLGALNSRLSREFPDTSKRKTS